MLSPGLRRLVLRSPDFAELGTDPCDVTAFRVSRVDYRHYTPAGLEPVDGGADLTIIVQRHGEHVADEPTPGHDLIEGWTAGDDVRVCQWSSTRAFRWHEDDSPVLLLGDATVISLATAMQRRATREGRDLLSVLEVPVEDVDAALSLVPDAVVVPAGREPGIATDAWLAENVEALRLLHAPKAYLAGHGQSIQRQRSVLCDVVGLDRRSIRTQPYWATGKAGL
ncbi:SIP domain-containing protein [Aeromicrobium sp. CF4.19]|uniref:SIP domain-containing protein n=1 Tax=Aeromicrobium sp. CF4.19 TaxID=3373082 RepID=UPI003EE62197